MLTTVLRETPPIPSLLSSPSVTVGELRREYAMAFCEQTRSGSLDYLVRRIP